MIKIQRASCPECLSKPSSEFVESDYSKAEVKSALQNMQYGKCCYCERKLTHLASTEREVDHYKPKSEFKDENENILWHLANKWENLLYACSSCNSKKGSQSPFNSITGERKIIDPSYEDIDPEDHIDFKIDDYYITLVEREGSSLGRSTIDILKFYERPDLLGGFVKLKLEIEATFVNLTLEIINGGNVSITAIIRELWRATNANHEFTAFRRNFIAKCLQKLNEDIMPELEAQYRKSFNRIEVDIHKGHETEM